MGGGGAMRSAAKIAGMGVVSGGGIRGAPLPSVDNQVFSAVRAASRPVSIVTSRESAPPSGADVTVQRPSWEIGDWEFAGGAEEDFDFNKNYVEDPMPRVVFGGAPTLPEAKEATSELKDALEKAYLKAPNSTGFEGGFPVYKEPCLSLLSNTENTELKTRVVNETIAAPVVPKHALQAFRFLSESPAAQTVVASIASDPKVWNAVFENEAFTEYIQSQVASAAPIDLDMNESVIDSNKKFSESLEKSDPSFDFSKVRDSGIDLWDALKLKVCDVVDTVSGFFQDIFGGSDADKKSADAGPSGKSTFVDPTTLGASVMGLAIMVITLVVLKRA